MTKKSYLNNNKDTIEGFNRVQDIMDNSDKLDKKAPYDKLVNNEYNKK